MDVVVVVAVDDNVVVVVVDIADDDDDLEMVRELIRAVNKRNCSSSSAMRRCCGSSATGTRIGVMRTSGNAVMLVAINHYFSKINKALRLISIAIGFVDR